MAKRALKSVTTEKQLPETIYVGTDKIEGYAKITEVEMQLVTKRREAIKAATDQANLLAVKKAYETAAKSKPEVEGKLAVLHIRILPPVEETPYTEATPAHLFPPEVPVQHRTPRYGEKFNIFVLSVGWTARWILLSEGDIDGLPSYQETKSKTKTRIGKTSYEFNCPQPLMDKITTIEKVELHVSPRQVPLKSFVEKYPGFDDAFAVQAKDAFFAELNEALVNLPKCPKECEETELAVTIGYPQPYSVTGDEVIIVRERSEMVQQPNPKVVTIKFEEYTYVTKGKWSWSIQRACGD
jgi:hypothetical protein